MMEIIGMARSASASRMKYSQNFLRSPAAVEDFSSALPGGALCIEIGAGDGALTDVIASHYERVIAYEIDPQMCRRLQRRGLPMNVELRQGDILDTKPPREAFDVASNVPFGSTSAIVRWCLSAPSIQRAILITELAYAKKRTGGFGRWSKVTVETFPWFEWVFVQRISRSDFRPRPSVDAAIIRLTRRQAPLLRKEDRVEWLEFVGLGFTGRGGSLYQSLKPRLGAHARKHFWEVGIDKEAVVAYVPPGAWVELFLKASHGASVGPDDVGAQLKKHGHRASKPPPA